MLSESPLGQTASTRYMPVSEETLLQRFDRQFVNVTADTDELIRRAQRIRYQVYCVEQGFEKPYDHPDGIEKDEFDRNAAHNLLAERNSGRALGTVRLILPRRNALERSFPIQRLSRHTVFQGSAAIPLDKMAEVSRFTISKELRRTGLYTHMDIAERAFESPARSAYPSVPTGPLASLGLIQGLVRMSAENGILYWCAMMEAKLLRMLAAMAVYFQPVGEPVEHHGLRQPCFCNVADVLRRVKDERPAFWDVLTDGGALWEAFVAPRQGFPGHLAV